MDIPNSEECPMLILACDGVWDVLSDQEAVDLVLERHMTEGPYLEAAKLLVSSFILNVILILILIGVECY